MQTFQNRPQTSMPFNKRLQYSQNIRLTSPTSTSNNKYYNTTNRFYSSRPQKRPQTSLKTISNRCIKFNSRNEPIKIRFKQNRRKNKHNQPFFHKR